MAENTVNMTLKLKSEGLADLERGSKNTKDNLKSAETSAQNIGSSMKGGSATSRRAASSAAARPTGAAGVSAGVEGGDVEMYNRARGAAGAAGGSARDFADQARGLGGLVRLYATFAANIFAVSAAFNALSRAMDTSNLVKGLDQLGAASGRNLGTLSKQLVAASGGAINLRDAMEATAKASSAGLSNRQIEQLAEGARKASQALGINMPDALNRLTRGVSKLEPELLDELGIYVKIDDAVTTYARSVGKAATSLSDFERRQAFAIATTTQLEQKFSNIDLDVNPYNKLSATLQNLLQTGLELINKVLGPIVKYLSESPTALATIVGLIGITLLKQVMPVLGQFREGLKRSAQEAAASAERIKNSFGDEFQQRLEARFSLPTLNKELAKTKEQIDRITNKPLQVPPVAPETLKNLKSLSGAQADEKGIAALQKLITTREKYVATGMEGQSKLSSQQIDSYKNDLVYLNAKKAALEQQLQLGNLRLNQLRQEAALNAAVTAAQNVADQPLGMFDPETIAARRLQVARGRTLRAETVSNAAENASIVGLRASWTLLNKEIADKGITGLNKYFTVAQGGLAALGSRLMGLVSIAGMWGMIIGAGFALWEAADAVFSKNKKQAEEASQALEKLKSSTEFIDTIFEDLSKKDPLARISTEAINAKATGFKEVTDALETALQKAAKQIETANWWDKLKDKVKGVFGQDVATQTGKQFIEGLSKSFQLLGEGSERQLQAVQKFKKEFGIDPRSVADFEKLLVKDPTKFNNEIAPKMVARAKELSIAFSNVGSSSSTLKTNLEAASKILKDFVTSALPTDPVSKFGAELLKISDTMAEALQDPASTLASIVDIAKSTDFQAILGKSGETFTENAKNYLAAASALGTYNEELRLTSDRLEQLQKQIAEEEKLLVPGKQQGTGGTIAAATGAGFTNTVEKNKELAKDLADANNNFSKQAQDLVKSRTKILRDEVDALQEYRGLIGLTVSGSKEVLNKATEDFKAAQQEAYERGVKYLQQGVAISFQKAAVVLSSAFADRLGESEAGIKRRLEIEVQSNKLQINQLVIQKELLTAQTNTQDVMERLIISVDLLRLQQKAEKDKTQEDRVQQKQLEARITGRPLAEDAVGQAAIKKKQGQQASLEAAKSQIDAQIIELRNRNTAAELKAQDQLGELRLKRAQEEREIEAERNKTALARFALNTKELAYLSESLLREKQRLEELELQKLEIQEITRLAFEREKQEDTIKRLRGKEGPDAARDRAAAAARISEIEEEADKQSSNALERRRQFQTKAESEQIDNLQKQKNFELETINIVRAANEKAESAYQSMIENRRQMALEELESAKKLGIITEQEYVREKARFELEKQRRDYAQNTRALEASQRAELQPIQQAQQKLGSRESLLSTIKTGTETDARTAAAALAQYDQLQQRIDAINSSYNAQRSAVDAANEARVKSIELMTQEQEIAAQLADTWNRLAQSISALGETGTNIAAGLQGAAKAIADFGLSRERLDKDYASKSAEIEKDRQATISVINSEMYDDEAQRSRDILKVNETAAKKTTDLTKSKVKTEKALEMDRDIAVIGSAKKLFKEKTAAYRVLATLEKAMHIARLIMDAKEIASTVAKTAINIVESGKRAFAAGQEAIAAAFAAKPWPLGLVAGGAMIAIMAGLLGKAFGGGGGGAAAPSGFGMEEQRQTEGTGKSWVNGQLVDTGGGKPGGGDGRASSLEKGLDLVAKYTFEGLNYSNGMLKALLQIEQNTRGAAYAVFRSMNPNDKSTFVGGIQTGQLKPNTLRTGAANTLGAAAGIYGGMLAGGAIAGASAAGLLAAPGIATTIAGFIGPALAGAMSIALPVIGLLLAKPLGKLFTSVFGGKVTRSIEDSGIVIEGTLDAIVDGTKGVVQEYANLKTVKSGGWFRRSKTSFETVTQDAQADVKRYFAGIFSGMRDTLKEAGKLLGKDVSAFLDTYVVKDFKVSSQGRTAEEFADALRGEVSEAFNKMAKAAFPELEKFADAGEEFGETVIRMAKQISVFDTAMKMIGRGGLSSANLRSILSNVNVTATTTRQVSTGTTTGTRQVESDQEVTQQEYDDISAGFVLVNRFVRSISYIPVAIEQFTTVTETSVRRLTATEINDIVLNITDTLIDLAGGMEQFLERAQAIRENFLTDAQKVGQIAAEIRPILDDLGVGSIRSKADFLTILNDAQDNLVTAATNLKQAELTADTADDAPAQQAFDLAAALVSTLMELAPGIAQVLDYEKKLATAREDQAMTIANLLGDEKLITAARDAQRARQLEDMDVALRPGQRYIWALEDEKRIKDELIKLQEDQIKKLEQTKSTVSNLIKTLSDFKSQLLGGSQTILTPQQVYQQKKAEYDALVTAASSSDENIRNSALAKLPQAASSFLDASRTMFASGTAYAADFNNVIQTLDAQGAELLSQEEYLAKQLTEMQTATDQLKGINTNTQDTATRMAMLEEALVTSQAAVATAAAMWTSSSGEPIANFLTSTSNGANVVAAINNASANTTTQNSQMMQATVGSIVQLGIDVDKSLEKWLKEYGWKNTATAGYDNAGP